MEVSAVKEKVHELYNLLITHTKEEQATSWLDITDCLLQVYKKIDTNPSPPILVSKLVNYIYLTAVDARLHFTPQEEGLINELNHYANEAGINRQYRANAVDKSQFYDLTEYMPIRR
ncbi:bacteriocin immunity protein [Enterococcus cecorum]|nr:bacteriocin immunity protein [Enterococcus cecorum]CAI3424458.1 bacteriocin immunity protein [Enterococcus cecorum]